MAIRRTYRSRNRALSALVGSTENVVQTDATGLDSAAVVSLINATGGTDSATVITLIEAANDSDRDAGTQTQVFRMSSTSELSTLSQHNGLGTEIGVVKVGDIAYTANPLKAFVLTNIPAPATGTYSNTGFRVQQGNGTVTTAHFDIVPSGQLPSENFAIGMTVSRATYAADTRTITGVYDTGGSYGKGYLEFTPSMGGYPPDWDNKYMHTDPVNLTTWHRLSFDSSDITSIAGSAAGAGFDSAGITSLIDSAYIQARQTDIYRDSGFVTTIIDSAYVQLRQSSVGSGGIDSAATLAIFNANVDSARATTYTYTASADQTSFSGADDNGATLSYSPGNLLTFLNGILLVDSADYTATTGTSVVLTSAANVNDIINITKFTGTGGGGGGSASGGTDSATVISLSGELKGNMFRINPQSLSQNVTIDSAENAHCAGPISFDSGVVLTINGNLVIS